ncbi:MAG: InlB B-repeat-containing protein, partial [Methanocorpusculum sp.]|nr:InlB B-repeat-containing protein [Methanocorpusculum sp.]
NAAISGGIITNNSAATEGSEVCYLFGTFNLSGDAQIGPYTTILFGGDENYITVPSAFTGNVANITPYQPYQPTISGIEDFYINGTDIRPLIPLDLIISLGTKIVQLPQDATAAYLNNFRLSPSLPDVALAYQDGSSDKALVIARGYNLTVTGGTGSGSYASGTNVSVSAIVPTGQTFENWTANVSSGTFENPDSKDTTYTMPAEDVEITARFKTASTPVPTATVTTKPTTPAPTATQIPGQSGSSGGNMDNAFRVLFDTNGGSSINPETGLSYGDRITQPADPVKSGYIFGGWYKDAALTTRWNFSTPIPGDMTLYAGWAPAVPPATTTPPTAATPAPTLPSVSAAVTTAVPASTTAADTIPTLTQA